MKQEIRLSGLGGQGLVLAGRILGEAATIYENLYAVQKQSYGPEARGGSSRSDVIIAEKEVSPGQCRVVGGRAPDADPEGFSGDLSDCQPHGDEIHVRDGMFKACRHESSDRKEDRQDFVSRRPCR